MSYKIFIETDDVFRVECSQRETFEEAKKQMAQMIVDLLARSNPRYYDSGTWDDFKSEFPEDVLSLIESYEKAGTACSCEPTEDDTQTYHYIIDNDMFEIYESDDAETEPSYGIETNTLNMNDSGDEYHFRLYAFAADPGALTIRMEKEPFSSF